MFPPDTAGRYCTEASSLDETTLVQHSSFNFQIGPYLLYRNLNDIRKVFIVLWYSLTFMSYPILLFGNTQKQLKYLK